MPSERLRSTDYSSLLLSQFLRPALGALCLAFPAFPTTAFDVMPVPFFGAWHVLRGAWHVLRVLFYYGRGFGTCDIISSIMVVLLIRKKATHEEIQTMLATLDSYIKIAVDVKKRILAGGGIMHADCEAVLLEDGSEQEDIWGANWDPANNAIEFEALINIRPRQNNRKMQIQDAEVRSEVEKIARNLLESS